MGSGVVAGMAATCTTQPFDMLKTRMQLKPIMYKNLIQSARKVYLVILQIYVHVYIRL